VVAMVQVKLRDGKLDGAGMCAFVCLCVFIYVCVCLCVCVSVWVGVGVGVGVCGCVGLWVGGFACVRACVRVCVRVGVCLLLQAMCCLQAIFFQAMYCLQAIFDRRATVGVEVLFKTAYCCELCVFRCVFVCWCLDMHQLSKRVACSQ